MGERRRAGARARAERTPCALASVIVVCWNDAQVLGRCLDQLAAQDHPSYEVIVVDDGSTDDSAAVAEAAAQRSALKLVRRESNAGCPAARNLGLLHARGETVAFLDADGFAAPDWLRRLTDRLEAEPNAGGVASTVFFDADPLVLNGAGGTVNRQGWAADLSMCESFEWAQIGQEALYAMGCGMGFRRAVLDEVGAFDERMLNYYDDVDYGIRVWRAGHRIVVAADAWIDHGGGASGRDDAGKRRLCERHRMRVVLKHARLGTLPRWAGGELRSLRAAPAPVRMRKLAAIGWNARHLHSTLAARWRLRHATGAPDSLIADSWGDGFPAGLPLRPQPVPEQARASVEIADPGSAAALLDGWYPLESTDGQCQRWAAVHAAALVSLTRDARRLRLEYAHPPEDTGGVELSIRRILPDQPPREVWTDHLRWQYLARSIENRPIALPAGDYELRFDAAHGWAEPPSRVRSLGLALRGLSFEEHFEVLAGGLDCSAAPSEDQLVCGWFDAEQGPHGSYRWTSEHAAAVVRAARKPNDVRLLYRLPPAPGGAVTLALTPLGASEQAASWRIDWRPGEWCEEAFSAELAPGDYLLEIDAEATWSNPGARDPKLPPENRSLGFALAALRFS
jgi:GT2 family glycosyltransferase